MIKTTEKQGYCKALVNVGGGRYSVLIRLNIFGTRLQIAIAMGNDRRAREGVLAPILAVKSVFRQFLLTLLVW